MRSRFFYNIFRRKFYRIYFKVIVTVKIQNWGNAEVVIIKSVKESQVNGFEKIYCVCFGDLSAVLLCGMQHREEHAVGHKSNIGQSFRKQFLRRRKQCAEKCRV